ncbi:hypothetical protein CB0940_07348 [Cercospora beticola]|uniref:Uncharacterized protein n=1 Tax=Cercospora beticola TaxID=122368 RepID=A0A2G5H9P1_CERBT|nr:hypothetical protein CB0940_07348 [Cercospora beticola]PIA89023.1 hypothetical protein CB0940_07348 [Cercospora beticola]WPB03289.1 hypothetical protein RHO25_007926 [Cercospora beticola]CAK1357990.1 unnamed protein product [Cercospora beticola]
MHFFILSTLFVSVFASPLFGQGEQKVLQESGLFCDNALFRAAKEPRAASAYCSAFLNIPTITVSKTIDRVIKTATKTTSTRTYLAYPVTTRVAQTITLLEGVTKTSTITVTTSISTTTTLQPLTSCPIAPATCDKGRSINTAPPLESRPACFTAYSALANLSAACKCLSVPAGTITKTITKSGAPTSTITITAAGKQTRRLTRTMTTATVTITPTHGATVTKSISAVETEVIHGPFKIASGPDYRLNPENGWAWSYEALSHDVQASFGGEADCSSSYFALNGTRLVSQYFDNVADFPPYSLVGNVKVEAGNNANAVHFTSAEKLTDDRVPLSCTFERSMDEANPHAACPLTCTYAGAAGGRSTQREGKKWYLGGEEGGFSSFTMYAYQYNWG